jgi:tetratricopeptide (TPR) repeat protein
MIRADEDQKPRDFTIVAALIGLAWQAHPSATLAGVALLLFVWFHRKVVGGKGIAWRVGLAALCAIGPIHLLPLFKHSNSALRFGDPGTLEGFAEYITGSRFTTLPNVWGLEGSRVASVGRYFWEEFLGIGALLVALGLFRLWRVNRRLLIGVAAWLLPVIVITVLFKLEGQHDFWMVAAWIPLWLVAGVGLTLVPKLRPAVAAAGILWAVIANRSDLDQRNYTLAETFGEAYLKSVYSDGNLELVSDDAQSTVLYLQRIRKVSPEVELYGPIIHIPRTVGSTFSMSEDWYYEKPPPPEPPGGFWASGPTLLTRKPSDKSIPAWKEPIAAEEVPKLYRRARGQYLDSSRATVRPEPYEKRLLRMLLLARKNLADQKAREGNHIPAMQLYESILALDPWMNEEPTAVYPLAVIYVGAARYDKAEETFKKVLGLDLEPAKRAEAYYFLAALCGARPEAAEWKTKALASPDLPAPLRAKLEGR